MESSYQTTTVSCEVLQAWAVTALVNLVKSEAAKQGLEIRPGEETCVVSIHIDHSTADSEKLERLKQALKEQRLFPTLATTDEE